MKVKKDLNARNVWSIVKDSFWINEAGASYFGCEINYLSVSLEFHPQEGLRRPS